MEKKFVNSSERIKYIIETFYGNNQAAFARALNILPQSLTKYIQGQSIGFIMLNKINLLGFNPNWIKNGEGDIFADNESGKLLKEMTSLKFSQESVHKKVKEDFESKYPRTVNEKKVVYNPNKFNSNENVSEVSTSPIVKIPKINEMTIDELREYKKRIDEDLPKIEKILEVVDES